MTVMKTLPPHTSIVSVEEYNEEAVAYRLEPIAEDRLAEAGNPFSYRSHVSQITNAGGSDALVSQSWSELTGKGNIEKTITVTKETETSFEYELSVNVVAWKKIGGARWAAERLYLYQDPLQNERHRHGAQRLGEQPQGGRLWLLVELRHVEHDAQWEKGPRAGLSGEDVSAPSSPPRDLAVETLTSTGATLTWSAGSVRRRSIVSTA